MNGYLPDSGASCPQWRRTRRLAIPDCTVRHGVRFGGDVFDRREVPFGTNCSSERCCYCVARTRNNSVFISFGQESLLFSRAMARKMTFVRDLYEVSSSNGVMEQHFHVGIACDRRQAEKVFLRGRKRREKCAKGSRVKGRERLFSGHAVTSV